MPAPFYNMPASQRRNFEQSKFLSRVLCSYRQTPKLLQYNLMDPTAQFYLFANKLFICVFIITFIFWLTFVRISGATWLLCLKIFPYMKYNPSKLKKYTKSKNSEKLQNAVNLPLWIFRPKILGICFHEAMA